LHMAQLMPLPLTVSCFSKIQIGFAFLVPAHPGSPGQRAVKRVCVCVCVSVCLCLCLCRWETLDSFMQHDVQELCRVVSSLVCILCWAFYKQMLCRRQPSRVLIYPSDGSIHTVPLHRHSLAALRCQRQICCQLLEVSVCVTLRCPSICLSHRSTASKQQQCASGLLLSSVSMYWSIAASTSYRLSIDICH